MTLRGPVRPYGMLVAVREEAQAILTRMLPKSKGKLGRFPFWRGTLARKELTMLQCGPGLKNAEVAARILAERQQALLLLSVGMAGGLSDERARGEIIIGTRVLPGDKAGEGGEPWEATPELVTVAQRAAKELHELADVQTPGQKPKTFRAVEGTLVSRDRVLVTSREKRQAGEESGADAVDMETRAVAAVARELNLPWLAIRVVSDPVNEDLPLDFNQFMDASGEPQKLKILFEGVKRPSLLGKLVDLEKTTSSIGEGLAIYLELLMPRLEAALEKE